MQPSRAVTDQRALNYRRLSVCGIIDVSAFTLVEVMMASVILVVGFIGMISAIAVGSEVMATARRQALAAQVLNHEVEKLRVTAWTGLPSAGTTSIAVDSQFNGDMTAAGVSFSLTRITTDVISNEMKEITFTITWTKSGTTTAANLPTGSWLQRLSFSGNAPIARTYTRKTTAYFVKYGLINSLQRL